MNFPIVDRRYRNWLMSDRVLAVGLAVALVVLAVVCGIVSWNVTTGVRAHLPEFDGAMVFGWLLAGLLVQVVVCAAAAYRMFSWWMVGGWAVGALGVLMAFAGLGLPWFVGVPACVLTVLVAGLLFVAWAAGKHRAASREALESKDRLVEKLEPFHPYEVVSGGRFYPVIFASAAVVALSLGAVFGAITTLVAPVGAPSMPQAGVFHVGGDKKPEVQILYSVNSTNATVLFGDDNAILKQLVEDGKVSLTVQGTAPGEQAGISVPVFAGEACAYDLGGESGWLSYLSNYNKALKSAPVDAQVPDMVKQAGESISGFSECVDSGKYTYGVQKYMVESQDLILYPYAKVFINGEEKEPQNIEELAQMIKDAS